MADITVGAQLTLAELAKRTNNKQMLEIAEVLSKKMPMLKDAPFVEGNQLTGHVINRRTYLTSGTLRGVNQGVPKSATQTRQLTEPIGLVEDRSEVDEYLLDLFPDPRQARYDEDIGHVEGLAQTMGDGILYWSVGSNPLGFDGFATRYATLATANVWNNGAASGNVSSAYFVQWGNRRVHFTYPRNAKTSFVRMVDLGKQLVEDGITAGNKLVVLVTQFKFNMGIAIWDDRCIQRVANIGVATAANNVDLQVMLKAYNNMLEGGEGAVCYVNSTVLTQLELAAMTGGQHILRWVKLGDGPEVLYFKNAPVRLHEKIKGSPAASDTESVLS